MKYFKNLWLSLLLLFACTPSSDEKIKVNNSKLNYIQQLQITETTDSIIFTSAKHSLEFSKKDLPIHTIMVVPTSVIAYLEELNAIDIITGVNQIDFIFNPTIHDFYKQNKIEEIGSFNELYIEKILLNQPDLLISTSTPTLAKFHELLIQQGVKILFIDEYEELNPLARAEYLKVFGLLIGKEKEAEQLFEEIETNYHNIQSQVAQLNQKRPTILSNQIYGDIWYLPGGKSFQAQLFKDAGGEYLWSDNPSEYLINLSFETVFEKANDADYWLNVGDSQNLESLIASYPNYAWFKAFQQKKVYNWSQSMTTKGGNDYFETGTARPDLVLKDLAAILYPDLFPKHTLRFYKALK